MDRSTTTANSGTAISTGCSRRRNGAEPKIVQGKISKKVFHLKNGKTPKLKHIKNSAELNRQNCEKIKLQQDNKDTKFSKRSQKPKISKLNTNKVSSLTSVNLAENCKCQENINMTTKKNLESQTFNLNSSCIIKKDFLKFEQVNSSSVTEPTLEECMQQLEEVLQPQPYKNTKQSRNQTNAKVDDEKVETVTKSCETVNDDCSNIQGIVKENQQKGSVSYGNEKIQKKRSAELNYMTKKTLTSSKESRKCETDTIIGKNDKPEKAKEMTMKGHSKMEKNDSLSLTIVKAQKDTQVNDRVHSNVESLGNRSEVTTCGSANAVLQKVKKQSKRKREASREMMARASNNQPNGSLNNAVVKSDELATSEVYTNEIHSSAYINVQRKVSRSNQKTNSKRNKFSLEKPDTRISCSINDKNISIPHTRKQIFDEKQCPVKIQKLKLSDSLVDQLLKKELTSADYKSSNSSVKESLDKDASTTFISRTKENEDDVKSSCKHSNGKYFDGGNRRHATESEYLQNKMQEKITKCTENEGVVGNREQRIHSFPKKRKVQHSRKADKGISEVAPEKKRKLFSIEETINDVVRNYSMSSKEYQQIKKNDIIRDDKNKQIRLSKIDKTIDDVIKNYSNKETTQQKNDTTTRQSVGMSCSSKLPVVYLENIFLNKRLVGMYNLTKYISEYKSEEEKASHNKTLGCQSTNSSFAYFTASSSASTSFNSSTSSSIPSRLQSSTSTEESHKDSLQEKLPVCEFSSKSNKSNYSNVFNLKITRNLGTNNVTISSVPLRNTNEIKKYDTVISQPDNTRSSSVDVCASDSNYLICSVDDFDVGDHQTNVSLEYRCYWTMFYNFTSDDMVQIWSHDEIFKNAEFSFRWGRDMIKEKAMSVPAKKEEKSDKIPAKKNVMPVIRRTVINDYANENINQESFAAITQTSGNREERHQLSVTANVETRSPVDTEMVSNQQIPPGQKSDNSANSSTHCGVHISSPKSTEHVCYSNLHLSPDSSLIASVKNLSVSEGSTDCSKPETSLVKNSDAAERKLSWGLDVRNLNSSKLLSLRLASSTQNSDDSNSGLSRQISTVKNVNICAASKPGQNSAVNNSDSPNSSEFEPTPVVHNSNVFDSLSSKHDTTVENWNSTSASRWSSSVDNSNRSDPDVSKQTSVLKNSSTSAAYSSNISALNNSPQTSLLHNSNFSPLANSSLTTVVQNSDTRDTHDSNFPALNNSDQTRPKKLDFKVPLLPPAKRPPTYNRSRQKYSGEGGSFQFKSPLITSKSSPSLNVHKNNITSHVEEDDDILSVCASSIADMSNFGEELLTVNVPVEPIPCNEESETFEELQQDLQGSELQNVEETLAAVNNVVEKDYFSKSTVTNELEGDRSSRSSLELGNIQDLQNNVTQWMAKSHATTTRPLFVSSATCPAVFRRLCYYHFIKNNCKKRYCNKMHHVDDAIGITIKSFSYEELICAYLYVRCRSKLYIETFDYFVEAFECLKSSSDLVKFVEDILRHEIYNKTPFVEKIVASLCKMGNPFAEVIEEILMCGGGNVCLSDILLDIVCNCYKQDICINWCIVQNLIRHRTQPVDHGLVEEIVTTCYQNKNMELAVNIVRDIIQPGVVNLKAINVYILNSFLCMLRSYKLKEEQVLLKQMELSGVLVIPSSPTHSGRQSCASAENEPENNEPNETSDDRSGSVNVSTQKVPVFSCDSGFVSRNVTAVPENDENKDERVPNSRPHSCNASVLDYDESMQDCDETSKNSQDSCHYSSQNVDKNTSSISKCFDNGDLEVNCHEDNSQITNSPSVACSRAGPEPVYSDHDENAHCNWNFNRDSEFDSNINEDSFNSQAIHSQNVAAASRSVISAGSKSHSAGHPKENVRNHLESHDSNEIEFGCNKDGNSSSSNSVSCIPVDTLDSSEMLPQADLLLLKNLIDREDSLGFLVMFHRFKDTALSRAFVLNTLAFFKTRTPSEVYKIFVNLITCLEKLRMLLKEDVNINHMLDVFTVNVLGLFEHHHSYQKAGEILLQFRTRFDDLRNERWFVGPHRYEYSEMGKFIYFCKILVRGGYLKEAWDILTSSDLKLLYGINKWTLKHSDSFDNKFRNYILEDLINAALDTDIGFAKIVILNIINDNNIITEINIWKHFNQLLLKMIDGGDMYIKDLTGLIEKIIEGWYTNLFPTVMRGLLACLVSEISETDAVELFDKCCKQKCYPHIKGDEKRLYLNTTMVDVEIYMILHVYLYKKVRNNFPLHNLTLMIQLPDSSRQQPQVLLGSGRVTVQDLKLKIYNVLAKCLPFIVNVDHRIKEARYVVIEANQLQPIIDCYSRKLQQQKRE